MPQTVPLAWYSFQPEPGEVAADDRLDRDDVGRLADHHPAAQPSSGPRSAGGYPFDRTSSRRSPRRPSGPCRAGGSGTIPAVSANQNRDRPVRTRPLSGIIDRQDDIEGADPVGRDEQQPAVVEHVQVADLAGAQERLSQHRPSPSPSPSGAARRVREPVEPGDDLRHVPQERGVVEAGVELGSDRRWATAGSTARRSRNGARSSAARSDARWTIA